MIYGKKYVFRWTPRLMRTIVLFLVAVFVIGGLLGFIIGRVSAASNDVSNEPPIQTHSEVTKPLQSENIEVISVSSSPETIEVENVYYDCPLEHDLQDYIRELCDSKGMQMDVVIALISVESAFKPDVVSGTSDYGLMQINKINHEWLSKEYGITDFLDPYQNVFCGIELLSQHYHGFQDVDKALMAYNLGATGARRLWDKGIYETYYTRKVRAAMEVYSNEI